MYSLKDNNHEVYKIFSEGNLDMRCAMIENGLEWHPVYLVLKQTIMRRPLKVAGVKNEIQVLKKLREGYDFSLCPLAQLLRGTNRSLY